MLQTILDRKRIYLLIGGEKCGSTSLSAAIRRHPEVFDCGEKGLNFFITTKSLSAEQVDWYSALGDGRVYFEGSAEYASYPIVPDMLDRIDDNRFDVRILYSVRDPLDRIESEYRMSYPKGFYKHPARDGIDFQAVLKSDYWLQINRLLERYGRNRILVLNFDNWRQGPASTFDQIARFMEISSFQLTKIDNAKNGVYWDADIYLRHELGIASSIYRVIPIKMQRLLGQLVADRTTPATLHRVRTKASKHTSLTPHQRQYVALALKPNIDKFCGAFGIDPATWSSYSRALEDARRSPLGFIDASLALHG
jgi:hypothetical protein